MKIISLFQIDDYRLTSKKGEGIKGTNSTRFHRSFDIHHVDFENGTSIGWFRVDQLPFTEKRVTIIARCRWYQTGRGQIAGRASWNGQFSTAYSRLIGFVSSWKSPMGDGPIHTENQDHTPARRADCFRKCWTASIRGVPVKRRTLKIRTVGSLSIKVKMKDIKIKNERNNACQIIQYLRRQSPGIRVHCRFAVWALPVQNR